MGKKKGSRTERELFHMFWSTGKFAALRIAGSGSTTLPAPDLLVGNKKKVLAIECKSTKKNSKYISEQQIEELKLFSKKFGAEPLVAIRFNHQSWFFLPINKIDRVNSGNYVISLESAKKKGFTFDQISH